MGGRIYNYIIYTSDNADSPNDVSLRVSLTKTLVKYQKTPKPTKSAWLGNFCKKYEQLKLQKYEQLKLLYFQNKTLDKHEI